MENKYKVINSDFHDFLLAKAALKQSCEISFIENSKQKNTASIITAIYTKHGKDFMVLKSGKKIYLNQIISVNSTFSSFVYSIRFLK